MRFAIKAAAMALLALGCAQAATKAPDASPMEHQNYCFLLSGLYSIAASMRDSSMSPQQAYATADVHKFIEAGIPKAVAKTAINNVYFNQAFALDPESLRSAVYSVCLHPHGIYKPLR